MAIQIISNHYSENDVVEMLLDSRATTETMINVTMSHYKWLTSDVDRLKTFITEHFTCTPIGTEYRPIALIGSDDLNLYGSNRRKRFNIVYKVIHLGGYGPNDEDLGSALGPLVINVIDDE